jgi:hypothetical protein
VTASVLAAAGSAAAQPAEPGVEAALRVYRDDDRVTVITPAASGHTEVGPIDVDLAAAVDVVSAASVDVVSAASPEPFEEQRWELAATGTWAATPTQGLRAGLIGSHERDYDSLRARAGWRAELARRNLTVDVDYTGGMDRIQRTGDPGFTRRRTDHQLVGSVTHLIDPRTYADVVVELKRAHGYQANPYRTVLVSDPEVPEVMVVAENTPRLRLGAAGLARVRRALGTRPWYVHGWYRFYADDWGVRSHTAGAQLLAEVGGVLAGVSARAYHQGRADFHRASYALEDGAPPALRTADRALGAMDTVHAGITCDAGVGRSRLIASVGALHLRFLDSPAQASRTALLVAIGFRQPL